MLRRFGLRLTAFLKLGQDFFFGINDRRVQDYIIIKHCANLEYLNEGREHYIVSLWFAVPALDYASSLMLLLVRCEGSVR